VDQTLYNYPWREGGIKSVTDAEIRSFLEKYFVTENMVLMLFGPKDHIIEILEKHWPDITIHVQPVEKAIE
jgi:predicted Zn-dependent peptidase